MRRHRFGFRQVLPGLVTALYVILILWGMRLEVGHTGMSDESLRHASFQEGTIEFHSMEPKPLSAPTRIALGVNFPACLVVALLSAAFHVENVMGLVWGGGILGCVMWYFIGRWLDKACGVLPRKQVRHPDLRDLMLFTVGPLSLLALVLSIASMTPLNRHGGPERYWTGMFLTFWTGLIVSMMADVLRNRKNA